MLARQILAYRVKRVPPSPIPPFSPEPTAMSGQQPSSLLTSPFRAKAIISVEQLSATLLVLQIRSWGHHTIRQKSYAKEPFGSPLPFGTVLKEGFERKSLRIFRSIEIHS